MGMLICLITSNIFAQTNANPGLVAALPDGPNILYAMIGQVLNNPSSLLVIAFLGIVDWLADDLPLINSKYVAHISVITGACIYWMFTTESAVPKSFPHPYAVFIVNGCICGFVAAVGHRQIVARLINVIQGNGNNSQSSNKLSQDSLADKQN